MKQELIPLTSPLQWREALANVPHAFGHTWESCFAMQLTTGFPTYLYVLQHDDIKVVCPFAERNYQGYTDIVTPYGFSGFAGNKDFPGFSEIWKDFMAQAGYVCGYIGLNPMLVNETYFSAAEVYAYNTLYVLNLQLSLSELYQQLSQNRKRQLKDFADRQHQFTTNKSLLKDFFLAQYHAFFTERNAAQVYNFSPETLSYLLDLENVILVGFTENEQVKAVSVFAYTAHIGEYLFNVSLPEGQNQTVPLLWHGVTQLKSRNVPLFNLGGGVKDNDSIAQFKQRFGAITWPLTCLKQVYLEPVYDQLCRQVQADPTDKNGYFPVYRRP